MRAVRLRVSCQKSRVYVRRSLLFVIFAVCAGAGIACASELFLEAESGRLSGTARLETSEYAYGGKYVEMGRNGSVTFEIEVERPIAYYAWARVLSAFPLEIGLDDHPIGSYAQSRPGEWAWTVTQESIHLASGRHTIAWQGGRGSGLDRLWLSTVKPTLGGFGGGWAERDVVNSAFFEHVDVTKVHGEKEYVLAYFVTFVESPVDREVLLVSGCDDSLKIWVNGSLVLASFAEKRSSFPYENTTKATLKKGVNAILIKSENGHGGWDFYFLMLDANHGLLSDLKFRNGLDPKTSPFPLWGTVGPFPSGRDRKGFDKVYPPEEKLDLEGQKWKPVDLPLVSEEQAAAFEELTSGKTRYGIETRATPPPSEAVFPTEKDVGAPQRRFWVSTEGNDRNPGSEEKPWRTLQKAAATLSAGDLVTIKPGVYRGELRPQGEGRPGAYIVYAGAKGAILNGSLVFDGTSGSFTKISGLKIIGRMPKVEDDLAEAEEEKDTAVSEAVAKFQPKEGPEPYSGYGIFITHRVHDVVIEDCDISCFEMGAKVPAGSRLFFRHLTIHDNNYGMHLGEKGESGVYGVIVEKSAFANNVSPSKWNTDGLCAEGFCTGLVITECQSSGHGDAGFDIKPRNTHLDRCLSWGNKESGFKLWWNGITVTNSIAYGNGYCAFDLAGPDISLVHCTILGAVRLPKGDAAKTIVVRNCILTGKPGRFEDHNLYFVEGEAMPGKAINEKGTIFADPSFIDPKAGDFRLKGNSPAIDAAAPPGSTADATSRFLDHDYLGQKRPAGKAPDLGAIESQ